MGAPHPDGTLFQDASSDSLYLTENGQRRPIVDEQYRDFLRQKAHPIIALEPSDQFIAHCTATASFFPRALNCELTLDSLANAVGPDYEITLSGTDTNINIATATLAFETRLDAKNMTLLLSKMKQRLLARFGLTPP
jgi:hypothetical protein